MSDREETMALAAVVDALNATTEELAATKAEVKRLRSYGRKNRAWIVFDIAITIVLAAVSFIAVHASNSAHNAQVSAVAARAAVVVAEQDNRNLCLSSNLARAQQIDLWTFVLDLNKGKPQTAQQKENTARFVAHLHALYAPRDCSHVNPRHP